MATNTSILQKSMTYSRAKIKMLIKSLKHSLRIEFEEKNYNYDYSKSGENVISTNQILKETNKLLKETFGKNLTREEKENLLNQLIETYIEDVKPNKIDPKILLSVKRDFKRFLKSDIKAIAKPSSTEKKNFTLEQRQRRRDLTQKILNYIENGLKGNVLTNEELDEYSKLVKPNRLARLDLIKDKTQDKTTDNTIQIIESFFKIPLENYDAYLSARECKIINEDYFKKFYPNYDVIASFEHNDEILEKVYIRNNKRITKEGGNHAHSFISAKNKLTGEFDYSKHTYNLVKNQLLKEWEKLETRDDFSRWYFDSYFELDNIPLGFLNCETIDEKIIYIIGEENKSKSKKQQLRLGIINQNIVFDFVNNHQIFKDKDLKATKYLNMGDTREKIFENKRRFQEEDKNKKNKSVYNGYNLMKENIEKLEELSKNLEEQLENQTEELEIKDELLEDTKTELENVKEKLNQYKQQIKDEALNEIQNEINSKNTKLNELNDEIKSFKENKDKKKQKIISENEKEIKKTKDDLSYLTQEKEEIEKFKNEDENITVLKMMRDETDENIEKFKFLKQNKQEYKFFQELQNYDDFSTCQDEIFKRSQKMDDEAREISRKNQEKINEEEIKKLNDEIKSLEATKSSLNSSSVDLSIQNKEQIEKINKNRTLLKKQEKRLNDIKYIEKLVENDEKIDNHVRFFQNKKNESKLKTLISKVKDYENNFDEKVSAKNEELNKAIDEARKDKSEILESIKEKLNIRDEVETFDEVVKVINQREDYNKNKINELEINLASEILENKKLSDENNEVKETNNNLFNSREDVIKERDKAKTELEKSLKENREISFENTQLKLDNSILESTIEKLSDGINYLKKEFSQVKNFFSSFTKRVLSIENIEDRFNKRDVVSYRMTTKFNDELLDDADIELAKEQEEKRKREENNSSSSYHHHH